MRTKLNIAACLQIIPARILYGLSITGLIALSLVNRLIDRNSDGEWTFLTKTLQPDGRSYLYFALNRVSGNSIDETLKVIGGVFNQSMFGSLTVELSQWHLNVLNSRPIYPILIELVPLTNQTLSLLLPPIVAWILLICCISAHINRNFGKLMSLFVIFLFTSSFYVRYNYIASTPDVIAGLFFFLSIILIIRVKKSSFTYLLILTTALIAMFTRPMAPIYISIASLALLSFKQRLHNRGILIVLGAIGLIHMLVMNLLFSQLTSELFIEEASLLETLSHMLNKLVALPKILIIEIGMVLVNDPVLAVLLILIFLGFFLSKDTTLKVISLGTLIAVFLMASMNGTIGNGFRYQMPLIICGILCAPETIRYFLQNYKSLN
jgi:hypothetical protein